MLVIRTQVYENYGAHDWDGKGECPQYWKAKGGHEYKVLGVPLDVDFQEVVEMANVATNNNYIEENVIDWSIENDDYLSDFERSQLEYEGKVEYAEPTMEYAELNARYTDPMALAEASADADACAFHN